MKYLVYTFAFLWSLVCLPLAIAMFYIKESLELANIFSSFIDKVLKRYN